MKYQSVLPAKFISRPNRFIAHVLLNGEETIAHVKNTGRCKELLLPDSTIYLEPSQNPERKTPYSLIAVEKGDMLINMDSQAPNKILEEAIVAGKKINGLPHSIESYKREFTYGSSRLDFMVLANGKQTLIEVKGVTLERGGSVYFPDAPTQRGIRHIHELIAAVEQGFGATIFFVIQMQCRQLKDEINLHKAIT